VYHENLWVIWWMSILMIRLRHILQSTSYLVLCAAIYR
jgi:hypothetical protein